jgi:hypothetical protein
MPASAAIEHKRSGAPATISSLAVVSGSKPAGDESV